MKSTANPSLSLSHLRPQSDAPASTKIVYEKISHPIRRVSLGSGCASSIHKNAATAATAKLPLIHRGGTGKSGDLFSAVPPPASLSASESTPRSFSRPIPRTAPLTQAASVAKVSQGLSSRQTSPKIAAMNCTPTQKTTNMVTGAIEAPEPSGENSAAQSTAANSSRLAALIKFARRTPSQRALGGRTFLPSACLASLLMGHKRASSKNEAMSAATAFTEKTHKGRGRSDLLPMP